MQKPLEDSQQKNDSQNTKPADSTNTEQSTSESQEDKGTKTENQSSMAPVKPDSYYIQEAVKNYTTSWAEAVNQHNFTIVEKYLIPGSNFYNSQKKLLESLYAQGTKEEFVNSKVIEYTYDNINDLYKARVYEEYIIKYSDGRTKNLGFNWVYTVKSKPYWGLSDIEEDTNKNNEPGNSVPNNTGSGSGGK